MPKILGQNLAEHRQKTRERLFNALGELLHTRTFDSLTMAEIAQAAGVGRTAVYNHFDDKESLLLAYIHYETARYSVHLRDRLASLNDPVKKLRVYIREQLILGATYHLAPTTNLRKQVSSHTSRELSAHGHEIEDVLSRILEEAMATGAIPRQNLLVAITMINGCLASRRMPQDPPSREFLIHSLQAFILRGIGVDPALAPLPQPQQFFGRGVAITQNPFSSTDADASLAMGLCPVHQPA